VLKNIFATLRPQADFHILTLVPQMFEIINFVPKSTFIPIAQLNISQISKLALKENYRGMAGHYLLLTNALLGRHLKQQQKVGTGYIGSKNCLFRELNRGVEWIFSNNAAKLQKIVHYLLRSH
jgi:glycerophosphoryl diester phosphodiesterase